MNITRCVTGFRQRNPLNASLPEEEEIRGQTGGLDERECVLFVAGRSNSIIQGCLELCRWKWEFTKFYRVITVSNRAT